MKRLLIPSPSIPGPLGLFRRRVVAAAFAWLLMGTCMPLLTGCHRYYRAREKEVSRENVNLLAESKTFVLHEGDSVWELRNPKLNGEVLEGTKAALSEQIIPFQQAPPKGKSPRFKNPQARVVLNIVHVYITEAQAGVADQVRIPFTAIKQIDLIQTDTGKTTASYVLGGLGVTVAVMGILIVVVALTKSSCPFVYAYDGHEYRFVGEAYSGAIFAPAERNDYLPLPAIRPENNAYRLKISNELKERQYTNLAELWVVQHPATTQVLLDQRGRVQTLLAPQPPTLARSLAGHDCTAQLQATDRNAVLFNDDTPGSTRNEVVMSFAKPAGARQGKLVLHAQNSLWLDYLYGAFIEKFGAYYNTWAAQQRTQPAAINQKWGLDQGIPLKVYVETNEGWQLIETIPTVGPLASRDLVVPLPLAATASGEVRVKLECGFMFWEVDYAALDYSPNAEVQLDNCRLTSATTERGTDARAALMADDADYLKQLRPGTAVSLTYETTLPAPDAQSRRTTFLRTKGYYEHIRDFQGLPNLPELYAFKKPGRFIEFSKEQYRKATQAMQPLTASR
ncbi:hypothetical protein I2I05_04125 [Hymenobacter sp. BT683]|uniref:Uncharacterized protein n=1 Tax=Hymenobacter jeongseonensis TaxID=2791027 RepID=A0ABS0IE11_9BACT|nr:hypothetical protein [Hymenobacter jeongseonensis]MBF9236576.1 hypothetical protein [Hymenobacter jeongseonensis]